MNTIDFEEIGDRLNFPAKLEAVKMDLDKLVSVLSERKVLQFQIYKNLCL